MEVLKQAERAYRNNDPEFSSLLDELGDQPAMAFQFTRLLETDLLWARKNRRSEDAEFLRAAVGRSHPIEERALSAMATLGSRAMPAIHQDLLEHPYIDNRQVGLQAAESIGAPAEAWLLELAVSSDPARRRTAVEGLGRIPSSPATTAALEAALVDAEFTVRAKAVVAVARHGNAAAVRNVLILEDDAFVRRRAAEELAAFEGLESARALVDYLDASREARDAAGVTAAQGSLGSLAGTDGRRSVSAWRSWLEVYALDRADVESEGSAQPTEAAGPADESTNSDRSGAAPKR